MSLTKSDRGNVLLSAISHPFPSIPISVIAPHPAIKFRSSGAFGTPPALVPLSDEMADGQKGMTEHHPRPCKSHHLPDPPSHLRFVAVDRTLAARRLVFP